MTTSSCAGRISIFLEGVKSRSYDVAAGDGDVEGIRKGLDVDGKYEGDGVGKDRGSDREERNGGQSVVPGGKGKGGRWLFVSHDPVDIPVQHSAADTSCTRLFGLSPRHPDFPQKMPPAPEARFVKFQFEPMVSIQKRSSSTCCKPAQRFPH